MVASAEVIAHASPSRSLIAALERLFSDPKGPDMDRTVPAGAAYARSVDANGDII